MQSWTQVQKINFRYKKMPKQMDKHLRQEKQIEQTESKQNKWPQLIFACHICGSF